MDATARFALVGPGRAGTALSEALVRAGWLPVAVAGRHPDAASCRSFAERFDAEPCTLDTVGRRADLVVVATPDRDVEAVASDLASSLEPGALVVHVAGSFGVEVFAALARARPDVRTGALHPLQTLAGLPGDADRLAGTWFAVDGDPGAAEIVTAIGGHPFAVGDRAAYHAAAAVAANHLVALVGQVERLAGEAGAPRDAFLPLMQTALDNAFAQGSAAALTGPVARGDAATVARHLERLPGDEQRAYRALALAALRLTGRVDDPVRDLLEGDLVGERA